MGTSRKEKQEEAIRRMKLIRYFENSIEDFKSRNRDGKERDIKYSVMVNEPPLGAHYYPEDELVKQIMEFEETYRAVVYAVVRSFTNIGKMDSLIYVSDWQQEWQTDMECLSDGYAMSYTINYDMPDCSEFGSIGFNMSPAGGLIRTF